jgi:hypothetical protein
MAPVRGEGTKAILVRGEAEDRLVPFLFGGVAYRVPAKLLRHHPNHPDCPVIKEALRAPNSWKETVTKGRELTSGTVRCTGGCWDAYEAAEQRLGMGLLSGLPRARRPRARPGRVKPAARPHDLKAP